MGGSGLCEGSPGTCQRPGRSPGAAGSAAEPGGGQPGGNAAGEGGVEGPERPQPSVEAVCDTGGREAGSGWRRGLVVCTVCLGNARRVWAQPWCGLGWGCRRVSVSMCWLFPDWLLTNFFTRGALCIPWSVCTLAFRFLLLIQQHAIYLGLAV